ncbi:MAG: tetraacyldisaccharide 4'-kinase [Candidatus Omnitrophica bacterium]|nr:tetraacyldisaccharide 4'-kinase [Candidatus Omnitrophota bacterium]
MRPFFYNVVTDRAHNVGAKMLQAVLLPLSYVYRSGVQVTAAFYRKGIFKQHRLPRPVISVGNITVGGTGKTPLVARIAKLCQGFGMKPVILTRGYMGRGMGSARSKSDEAAMLEKSLEDVPVLAGADRVKSARAFLEGNQADIFILDDGFQQWRLARDMDIVVIDATDPWGNGRTLPRGILREPLNALRRADWIILTKTDSTRAKTAQVRRRLKEIGCAQPVLESVHRPVSVEDLYSGKNYPPEVLAGRKVCVLCSLGAPETFGETLTRLGAEILRAFNFTDHHVYSKTDITSIAQYCRANHVTTVVTTQKDAVKLTDGREEFREGMDVQLFALNIELVPADGKEKNAFVQRIADFLQR